MKPTAYERGRPPGLSLALYCTGLLLQGLPNAWPACRLETSTLVSELADPSSPRLCQSAMKEYMTRRAHLRGPGALLEVVVPLAHSSSNWTSADHTRSKAPHSRRTTMLQSDLAATAQLSLHFRPIALSSFTSEVVRPRFCAGWGKTGGMV